MSEKTETGKKRSKAFMMRYDASWEGKMKQRVKEGYFETKTSYARFLLFSDLYNRFEQKKVVNIIETVQQNFKKILDSMEELSIEEIMEEVKPLNVPKKTKEGKTMKNCLTEELEDLKQMKLPDKWFTPGEIPILTAVFLNLMTEYLSEAETPDYKKMIINGLINSYVGNTILNFTETGDFYPFNPEDFPTAKQTQEALLKTLTEVRGK
ncbi:MAG: hypothetical protein L6265_07420 [Thermoplasmatales archaeon]|nr:hypothetical protein [Thermoplasmatales archaeon]